MSEGIAHLAGDYIAQSDWMAERKTAAHGPAVAHALTYTACFVPVTRSWRALAVIGGTHFVIDRWRLARYLVWVKNQAAPVSHRYPFSHAGWHGYHGGPLGAHERDVNICQLAGLPVCEVREKPEWMAGWLLIVADNTLHLAVNRWALRQWR